MKILKAEFHFALPDDFDGSLADALRNLAGFVEQEQKARDTEYACFGASWGQFLHNLTAAGCRFTGKTSMNFLVDGKPWKRMPQGIACGHHDESGAAWIK